MSSASITAPSPAARAGTSAIDKLVDELVTRWNGEGAPEPVLARAARLRHGFKARHTDIRNDRQLLANTACIFAFICATGIIVLTAGLVDLVIASGEEHVRILLSALLLGLAALTLSRAECRLPLQTAAVAGLSVVAILAPAVQPGLAEWDHAAALLGCVIVAGKAVRLALDNRLNRAEARLLLDAAGCR
jgi:hypothetical protein